MPSDLSPSDVDDYERQLFADNQRTAAAAAATAAGYDASLTGEGAEVVGTVRSAPAASALEMGDVITAVDGAAVRTVSDLHDTLAGHSAGERVTLTVRRDGRTRTIQIETARLPQVRAAPASASWLRPRICVSSSRSASVSGRGPTSAGSSAGLAYALALTDMLDRTDDARSRTVAATGTIDADARSARSAECTRRRIAARDAGAQVFVVPAEELSAVDGDRRDVRGVEDRSRAVQVLQAA